MIHLVLYPDFVVVALVVAVFTECSGGTEKPPLIDERVGQHHFVPQPIALSNPITSSPSFHNSNHHPQNY